MSWHHELSQWALSLFEVAFWWQFLGVFFMKIGPNTWTQETWPLPTSLPHFATWFPTKDFSDKCRKIIKLFKLRHCSCIGLGTIDILRQHFFGIFVPTQFERINTVLSAKMDIFWTHQPSPYAGDADVLYGDWTFRSAIFFSYAFQFLSLLSGLY